MTFDNTTTFLNILKTNVLSQSSYAIADIQDRRIVSMTLYLLQHLPHDLMLDPTNIEVDPLVSTPATYVQE